MGKTTCLYCQQSFQSKGSLFRHLKRMIPPARKITSWHQDHFCVTKAELDSALSRLVCPARCCRGKCFDALDDLLSHMRQMGVQGADEAQNGTAFVAEADVLVAEAQADEDQVPDVHANLGKCFKCSAARQVVFAPCGHAISCAACARDLAACPVCSEQVTQKIDVCWS